MGSGFSVTSWTNATNRDVLCSVGGVTSSAVSVSPLEVVCVAPALPPGLAFVRVWVGSEWVSAPQLLLVRAAEQSTKLAPASGSALGGTLVRVSGKGFADSNELACKFGEALAKATFVSAQEVVCETPSVGSNTSRVGLAVSNNGLEWAAALPFAYSPQPRAYANKPSGGPVSGGTRVTVTGAGFVALLTATGCSCRFGEHVTRCSVESDFLVACVAPAATKTGAVPLELLTGAGEIVPRSHALSFAYRAPVRLQAAFPLAGPERGATRVKGASVQRTVSD